MKIIISPARRMKNFENECFETTTPLFLKEATYLASIIKKMSIDEIKKSFKCSQKIAVNTYNLYRDFFTTSKRIPAILAFNGIQYLNMAPHVFNNDEINYVKEHLYIMSGLYGILRPYDEISLYRLDYEADLVIDGFKNLLAFWNTKIYNFLFEKGEIIINLASSEYRRLITKYLKPSDRFIDVYFYQQVKDKLVEKIVYVKEARGSMVRFLAQTQANSLDDIKKFNLLGYQYSTELSTNQKIIFIREEKKC